MQPRNPVLPDGRAVLRAWSSRRSSRSPSPGGVSAALRMNRSRATFASTDAPAIAALCESPPTTARCSIPKSGTRKPSTRHSASSGATCISAWRSAARLVLCSPRASMPRTQRDTITAFAAARMTSGYSSSRRFLRVLLRVVEPRERAAVAQREPVEVEQHGRGEQRPCQTAAAGLVRPGHEAVAELTVERKEPPAAALRRACALGRARDPAVWLEAADLSGRPVGGEGIADDPLLGDGAPFPAVCGFPTVVAHHEVVIGRDRDLFLQIAGCTVG